MKFPVTASGTASRALFPLFRNGEVGIFLALETTYININTKALLGHVDSTRFVCDIKVVHATIAKWPHTKSYAKGWNKSRENTDVRVALRR
jgi:hypothetical protein